MTKDEEVNISHALSSVVDRFNQIIVVDSFSTDETVTVVKQFPKVELYMNEFTHWAHQRNWILDNCKIINDWVFFLDADESIDELFFVELSKKFSSLEPEVRSMFLYKDLYFLNKKLSFAYSHPKIQLIFHRDGLRYHAEGAREFATCRGNSITIKRPLIHKDRRSFDFWVLKHIRNAEREKNQALSNTVTSLSDLRNLPTSLAIRKLIRYFIWNKLSLSLRPVMNFFYRYFFRLGFLDGSAGFYYCLNHALWYESLVAIKIIEHEEKDS